MPTYLGRAEIGTAAGALDDEVRLLLGDQAVDVLVTLTAIDDLSLVGRAVLKTLDEMGPSDVIEGMHSVQMLILHAAALDCMKQATIADDPRLRAVELARVEKFTKSFRQHLEALRWTNARPDKLAKIRSLF
jgi:hypothetical protein